MSTYLFTLSIAKKVSACPKDDVEKALFIAAEIDEIMNAIIEDPDSLIGDEANDVSVTVEEVKDPNQLRLI